ncbi:MAG: hypothetical protein EA384_03720 [Spirochaetaceae bacterium]|nr:MAG: hypothetical protein EA384_03720 [Spirochaetaceae bacterium]
MLIVALSLAAAVLAAQPEEVPRGFRAIELGLAIPEVQRRLIEDANFSYRGEPDVSLLPATGNRVIESGGYTYIRRAWFQFRDDVLFSITLVLNPAELDHYGMYTALVDRYGEPVSLSPRIAMWESDRTRLTLERPLTVKYVDRAGFDELLEQGRMQQSVRELSRRQFIDQF